MTFQYLIAGLGKTGYSIARYLKKRKLPFIVYDTRESPNLLNSFRAEFKDVEVFTGKFVPQILDSVSTIITSPGISINADFIKLATQKNINIYGDIECLINEINAPVIAITGTNGKSTVTTLVGDMAKEAGLKVAVAGNIGLPVLDILDVGIEYDLWVLELSSFQLEYTKSLKARAATILNVTPDHLDRHGEFNKYCEIKQIVYKNAENIIYNRNDPNTLPINESSKNLSFGLDKPSENNWGLTLYEGSYYITKGSQKIINTEDLKIKGRHNWLNAQAACALADSLNIPLDCMVKVLKRFAGLPHRSQWVRRINGIDWYNDSKGTNVGATISAIAGIGNDIKGRIVLIAGGQGKGANFNLLRDVIQNHVRSIVLIGQDAPLIESALCDLVKIVRAQTLDEAVICAYEEAQNNDVVLLSPACASFDMFRDFNQRGDDFILKVNSM